MESGRARVGTASTGGTVVRKRSDGGGVSRSGGGITEDCWARQVRGPAGLLPVTVSESAETVAMEGFRSCRWDACDGGEHDTD